MSYYGHDSSKPIRIKCGPQGNKLLDLSPEIHLLILSHLDPFALLSARKVRAHEIIETAPSSLYHPIQTSRGLFMASNERRLWIDILRRLCYSRDVYLATYDLQTISLSDLEKATCNPAILERHLLRESNSEDGPDKVMVTLSSTVLDDTLASDRNSIRNLYFIPGGRYLLGFSPRRIQIWDLIDPTQPRRISSMDLSRTGRILNTDVHCPASGKTVYLFAQMFVVPGTKYADQGYAVVSSHLTLVY